MTLRTLLLSGSVAGALPLVNSPSNFAQTAGGRSGPPAATPPQPATPAQNPATPPQNPATPAANPASPPQNPATPPQNPATPSPTPIAPGQPAMPNSQPQPARPHLGLPAKTPARAGRQHRRPQSAQSTVPTALYGVGWNQSGKPKLPKRRQLDREHECTQGTALIQAVTGNPLVRQTAAALTQRLRQQNRITPDQQVVGVNNGQVYIATNAQVANATAGVRNTQLQPLQPATMVAGLATANNNVQTMNVQGVTTATNSLLNQNQLAAVYQSLNNNIQARQAADALTNRLLADGRIRGVQRVIGFQDGRAIVTPPDQ